ncbi:MAG TPA: M20/M25/M40 family metallo-hydrolase [Terriglobales bacterium]|jgi:acetylornithine deacetylase/succinyl-diaminopimelate desuccinylase-like protein|nr:M20/M25/M40 family metallo-hydrolase [Terriglobales bacterium]
MSGSSVQRICTFGTVVVLLLPLGWTNVAAVGAARSPKAALASAKLGPDRVEQYADLALHWMQEYLRIDTTNPPGNEMRAATFFKKILDQEGIENRVFEYQPGRANLWARIPHSSSAGKRPILLLNHMDVVTSDAAHWRVPPFSGQMVDGVLYGRGAQDMKNEGLAQLVVMVMLKREKTVLDRDVIFLAVSDEEAASTGTDWIIANQRDLLGNAQFLINEGGENPLENGKVKYIGVDVGEKSPFWLHLVAHGRPGHGSRPIADSAPNQLVHALSRILAYRTPFKVLPIVEESLREMAVDELPARARQFRNIRQAMQDRKFQQQVEQDESLNFLLRDTISLTMLGGSEQTNVIPAEAWANLDVRLLPGEDAKQFLETLRRVVNDPDVSIEPQQGEFRVANYSPTNTALFAAIRQVSAQYFPGTPVVPRLTSGYTENQRYRPLGMEAYGFTPYTATDAEGASEHGNDERVRVEEVRRAPRILYDVVMAVAGAN